MFLPRSDRLLKVGVPSVIVQQQFLLSNAVLPLASQIQPRGFLLRTNISEYNRANITAETVNFKNIESVFNPRYFHMIAASFGCKDQSYVVFSLMT